MGNHVLATKLRKPVEIACLEVTKRLERSRLRRLLVKRIDIMTACYLKGIDANKHLEG